MNKNACAILLALGLSAGLAETAPALPEQNRLGSQGTERKAQTTVEIGNDSGGIVAEYALRLYEMQAAKEQVKFVGRCDSACTLFLALPIEKTCITEGTYFRFHVPSAPSALAAARVEAYMIHK
jgi:hypothetical protein